MSIDVDANRRAAKYGFGEQALRILWAICLPFFRFSPRPFFGWRRLLLRVFGAQVGREVNVYASATILMPWKLEIGDFGSIGEHAYVYNLGQVAIGSHVTISQRAHLCAGTHDHEDPTMPLLKPGIAVGDQAWICADAFVGPGVAIGEGAVVGARAVVMKDVEPWAVVVGNPARKIKDRVLRGV